MDEIENGEILSQIRKDLEKDRYKVIVRYEPNKYNTDYNKTTFRYSTSKLNENYAILDSFFKDMSKEITLVLIKEKSFLISLKSISENPIAIYRLTKIKNFMKDIRTIKKEYSKKGIYVDFCLTEDSIKVYIYNEDLLNHDKTAVLNTNTFDYLIILEDKINLSNHLKYVIEQYIKEINIGEIDESDNR